MDYGQQYIPHIYNIYIPYGFIPNVETCRGASLYHVAILRNIFRMADFIQYIYIPYIYIMPRQPNSDVDTCRGASPTPTRQYAPNVETCRGASLPRGQFYATYFTWRILYNIFISPIYIMYISTTNNSILPSTT